MTHSGTIEEKVTLLRNIICLCNAKEAGIEYNEVYSNQICLLLFILFFVSSYFLSLPFNVLFVLLAAFIFGVLFFVRPKIRKRLRTTNERIYTSVYAYVSPLSEHFANKHNSNLAMALKEKNNADYVCIRDWARIEREAINRIIYSRTREFEVREILIEKAMVDTLASKVKK